MTLTEFLLARIAEDEAFWGAMPFGPTFGHAETWERMKLDCAAKRQIVGQVIDIDALDGYTEATRDAVRALAAVHADHPDYRAEWSL